MTLADWERGSSCKACVRLPSTSSIPPRILNSYADECDVSELSAASFAIALAMGLLDVSAVLVKAVAER